MTRPYVRSHERILVEYLEKYYPLGSWATNQRLGRPTPEVEVLALTPKEKRMLEVSMPIADAVVLLENEVVILEVETEPKITSVCQVELYGHLFGTTERFRQHWHKPRRLIVVGTIENDLLRWWANIHGVAWVVYEPIWWAEHIATRQARKFTPMPVRVPGLEENQSD